MRLVWNIHQCSGGERTEVHDVCPSLVLVASAASSSALKVVKKILPFETPPRARRPRLRCASKKSPTSMCMYYTRVTSSRNYLFARSPLALTLEQSIGQGYGVGLRADSCRLQCTVSLSGPLLVQTGAKVRLPASQPLATSPLQRCSKKTLPAPGHGLRCCEE